MTPPPLPVTLDAATLRRLLDAGDAPRLIDVRTPGEFESAHIPGSYNVPLDLLREHRAELRAHLDEPVVLICHSGQRAAQAEQALAAADLPNPRVLHGGISAWQAAGGTVATGRPRWALERQVRLVAGSLVLGSVLASTVADPAKWLAAALGAGLTVAALTNTCAMGMALAKLPYSRGSKADIRTVLTALAEPR
ncbi:rhodanese-related sulfurtransferase [Actinomadura pelletieri DSM 43383]|uniref:Rhodanese-related sulfurtransferase n=1 Tax=Actinomadura pelletieri DSM 43383 TaxID=1120940 RepID=A0A495QTA0_9ACTN|nr:rhodanese-like domain-containing protein [Actinomadura pelletieri]RKS76730.1 rhodanese-related sulfurtransferase [Actinomadura pelletieri DSM 43383]